jgi:hypothetical protein
MQLEPGQRELVVRWFFSPKGWDNLAQGEALGCLSV